MGGSWDRSDVERLHWLGYRVCRSEIIRGPLARARARARVRVRARVKVRDYSRASG